MSRPSLNEVMLDIAASLARRATCTKLAVGCVLTNIHGRIVGTGYNGVPHRFEHCTSKPCKGSTAPAGSDLCIAVHAEANALLTCAQPFEIHTCYTTHAPCLRCTKTLLNTSCRRIVYSNTGFEAPAKDLWLQSGGTWSQYAE